jgi:5'-nucleotidase (lipoprotein e(P4) family)
MNASRHATRAASPHPPRCARTRSVRLATTLFVAALPVGTAARAHEFAPIGAREQLHATLWMQTAPEYRAVAEQTYRLASAQLGELAKPGTAALEQESIDPQRLAQLPTAIILDLDETVLDNSYYQARQLRLERGYDEPSWQAWMRESAATLIPGAKAFLDAAAAAGHRVFYVTNRDCLEPPAAGQRCAAHVATRANLKRLGLPFADSDDALMLRRDRPEWSTGDKGMRRAHIAQSYRIIALFGDDLGDFASKAVYQQRRDELAARFGQRWFMLPNPIYGSWERALSDPACGVDTPPERCAERQLERKYASLVTAPPPSADELAAAARYRWDAASRRVRVATWNVEYVLEPTSYEALAPECVADGGRVPGSERRVPCAIVPRLQRTAADFDALRRYGAQIDGDVIALQEVDGPGAAQQLFPGYAFCFTTRPNVQKNGFAIRQGLPFRCESDYRPLSLDDRFRRGVVVTLFPDTADEMRLMNVHLKSGCPAGPIADARTVDCESLAAQLGPLESWIDEQARAGRRFAVLGDFNRRFARESGPAWTAEGRPLNVWPVLDDGDPAGADLVATTERQPFQKCVSDDPFDSYVDHVVLGRRLARQVVPRSWIRVTYSTEDARRFRLSDHCPVGAVLELR